MIVREILLELSVAFILLFNADLSDTTQLTNFGFKAIKTIKKNEF